MLEVGMSNAQDEEYRQEVMLTCKILLDSLKDGQQLDLSGMKELNKNKLQFVANIIKFGDTFRSDSTQPIYGLLFTAEEEEYLMKKALEIGLDEKAKALLSLQVLDENNGDINTR